MEAVEEALARRGAPEIFNTDQGSRFTSTDFIKVLAAGEIKISMDGKGAWRDNPRAFTRTNGVHALDHRAPVANHHIGGGLPAGPCWRLGGPCVDRPLSWLLHNSRRPRSSLDGKTPDQTSFNQPMPEAAAA